MADDTPDPARILKLARQALTSAELRKKFHLADFFGPNEFYEPQLRFFAEGARRHQRLLRGGNQVGKSFACAFEAAMHTTGQYPKWWKGKKFNKPTRGWVIGPTAQLVRDGPQRQLCSRQGEFGTGTIGLAAFAGKPRHGSGRHWRNRHAYRCASDRRRQGRPINHHFQIVRDAVRKNDV